MSVVETKICKHCSSSFDIMQEDLDFYAKVSPKFGDYTASIPTPTLCPDCRHRRRLAFRNERKLYTRTCDASKRPIISIYSPDKPYKVYDQKIRWSDARDPMEYGRDLDFSKTFTEQFGELMREVPIAPLTNEFLQQENCDYTNSSGPGKNCYMTFEFAFCESIHYSKSIFSSKESIDCTYGTGVDNCYYCTDCDNCFSCFYSQYCNDCSYCKWCYNCKNCQYCINCDGLENKKYCIENREYQSRMEFEIAMKNYSFRQRDMEKLPHGRMIGNENVTQSYNILNSRNSSYVRGCQGLDNVKFAGDIFDVQDTYDFYSWGENVSQSYELQESGRILSQSAFLRLCWDSVSHAYYSFYCTQSSHLFGCIGLRNKEYCIFNKQYTKEEYNTLVPKIIEHMKQTGEWGEFFHPSLSPFGYNETVANEYYPVQKAPSGKLEAVSSDGKVLGLELSAYGYKRSDYEAPQPHVDKIIPGEKLPAIGCADIQEKKPDFLSDILRYAIRCEVSGKLFRLIPQEIAFYTKHNLPLPRKHPDARHAERMALRR